MAKAAATHSESRRSTSSLFLYNTFYDQQELMERQCEDQVLQSIFALRRPSLSTIPKSWREYTASTKLSEAVGVFEDQAPSCLSVLRWPRRNECHQAGLPTSCTTEDLPKPVKFTWSEHAGLTHTRLENTYQLWHRPVSKPLGRYQQYS